MVLAETPWNKIAILFNSSANTPPPPPPSALVRIFPQVGDGIEFIFPDNQPDLISRQFIESEDCRHSGPYGLQIKYSFTAGGGGGWGVHWADTPMRHFDASSFNALTF